MGKRWHVVAVKLGEKAELPMGRRCWTRWGARRERARVARLCGWTLLRTGIRLDVRRDG